MEPVTRPARPDDLPAIEALLPRLADFEVPPHRRAEDLWHGDRELAREWAAGTRDDVLMFVATLDGAVVGVAGATARADWLTSAPSVHVELLAVDAGVEGRGIGAALLGEVEAAAVARGVATLSLNVFTNNRRARALYERAGFDGELMRFVKPLGDSR